MNPLLKFAEDHHEAIVAVAFIASLSFANTVPEQLPYKPQDLWTWFRNFLLEFMSLRSGRLVSGPPPKAAVAIPEPIDAPKTQTGETHV